MPCSRHSSGTGVPASACLRIAMIWLSVNFDVFIKNLLRLWYEKILLLTSVNLWGDYHPYLPCSKNR
ncbi:hypothetical protein DMC15_06800 [Vibrio sp. 11986-1-5]|nr:hypothetical protein DMC15_06800 [Vibrio sp. 11986-1-5]